MYNFIKRIINIRLSRYDIKRSIVGILLNISDSDYFGGIRFRNRSIIEYNSLTLVLIEVVVNGSIICIIDTILYTYTRRVESEIHDIILVDIIKGLLEKGLIGFRFGILRRSKVCG